jgi:poly(hydroxyalkanoate) depolymerase family esterase
MTRLGPWTLIVGLFAAVLILGVVSSAAAEMNRVDDFLPSTDENPGDLSMYTYVPAGLPSGSPLVVALHGCSQTAEEFARDAGWVEFAESEHFALLLPQQEQANNYYRCFNWFQTYDNERGKGEAASIASMVKRMKDLTQSGAPVVDETRIFVTGLSAGGGMTTVMLSTYPKLFAGGGIVAGVPYGCATTRFLNYPGWSWWRWWTSFAPYGDAAWALYLCGVGLGWMPYEPVPREPDEWGTLVRDAPGVDVSDWPTVSIWHGEDDEKVHPKNLDELVKQWTDVHGIDGVPDNDVTTEPTHFDVTGPSNVIRQVTRHVYRDADNVAKVESYSVTKLDHSIAVDDQAAADQAECGNNVPPYVRDINLCAVQRILTFWGLR